jgi:hypothetical protein
MRQNSCVILWDSNSKFNVSVIGLVGLCLCCRVVSAEEGIDGIGEVRRDVVNVMLRGEESEDDPAKAKPGAKLQRLKEELQQQMAQRRADEWGRHLQEQQLVNEEEENEEEGEKVEI